jgi:hypothetical protein
MTHYKAVPAKYFAFPPYTAELLGPNTTWAGVSNKNGLNVLTFMDDTGKTIGQTITTLERAKKIAEEWNRCVESLN